MVKVIYKKGKKYLIVDHRQYGPLSLYYHIQRYLSSFEYLKESGQCDEKRLIEIKSAIEN